MTALRGDEGKLRQWSVMVMGSAQGKRVVEVIKGAEVWWTCWRRDMMEAL